MLEKVAALSEINKIRRIDISFILLIVCEAYNPYLKCSGFIEMEKFINIILFPFILE